MQRTRQISCLGKKVGNGFQCEKMRSNAYREKNLDFQYQMKMDGLNQLMKKGILEC